MKFFLHNQFLIKITAGLGRYRCVVISLTLGFACLFSLMYSNNALRRESARRFHSQGTDLFSIINRPGQTSQGPAQLRPLQHSVLNALKRDPSFVVEIAPELYWPQQVRFQEIESLVPTIGVFSGYRTVFDLHMMYGRFFSDLDSTRSFCLVGNRLWKKWTHDPADSLIGRSIQVGKQVCTVTGVLAPSPTFSGEYRLDDAILLPYYAMTQFSNNRNFSKVTIRTHPSRNIAEAVDYIQSKLVQLLGDISVYEISNQALFAHTISQRMKYISMIMGSLGGIALVFGVWQLLLALTLERIQYDGTRRQVKIFFPPVRSAMKVGLISSISGAMVGQIFTFVISSLNHWVWQFSIIPFLLTIIIGCLISALIGWRVDKTP